MGMICSGVVARQAALPPANAEPLTGGSAVRATVVRLYEILFRPLVKAKGRMTGRL